MSKTMLINQRIAAAKIAYAFSDVIEFSSGNFMQAKSVLLDKVDRNETNLFGQNTRIFDYVDKDDNLTVAFGAMKGGALASVFIEDTGVTCVSDLVNKFNSHDLPVVFYVATDDTNVCKYNIPDGVGVVFPANAQEVVDLSILAHLSVGKSYKPFVVCLNNRDTGLVLEEVDFPSHEDINRLFDVVALCGTRARALKRGMSCGVEVPILIDAELPEIVDYYLGMIKQEFGREYKLIDYIGSDEAEKVLVSAGSETLVIEETVKKMAAAGDKVGLVKINVIAPFNTDSFKSVLPISCKKAALVGYDYESCQDKSLFMTMKEVTHGVDWCLDSYFIGMNDCKEGLIEKAFTAMDNDQKPEGESEYFQTSMDSLYYANDIKPILDMGEERLVIANSAAVNNIDFGLGMSVALEQRRAWIMNEVLFLADNTVYPSVAVNGYAYLDVKDDPKKSYQAGQVLLEDEVRACFACSTCTNITVAEEMLTKKYIWIFGGDARDASLDTDAIKRALATGSNINIITIQNKELYKKASTKTGKDDVIFIGTSMSNVLTKGISADMEKDQIEAILRQCELHAGPSLAVFYV
jgi:hypothetical protein